MEKRICQLTQKEFPRNEVHKGESIRKNIFDLIVKDHPDFNSSSYISIEKLNHYRKKYLETLIQTESGEISQLEKQVLDTISEDELISANIENELKEDLTGGQKIADIIATFGGSWTFIITFFSFLIVWMAVNVFLLTNKPFDPYPFILLNLILSCLAAIQAPIIMMSQNRKEEKDRKRSEHDYKVNLKAELEIRLLNEKLDHLIVHQNQKLLEIQEIQTDYLQDIVKILRNHNKNHNQE